MIEKKPSGRRPAGSSRRGCCPTATARASHGSATTVRLLRGCLLVGLCMVWWAFWVAGAVVRKSRGRVFLFLRPHRSCPAVPYCRRRRRAGGLRGQHHAEPAAHLAAAGARGGAHRGAAAAAAGGWRRRPDAAEQWRVARLRREGHLSRAVVQGRSSIASRRETEPPACLPARLAVPPLAAPAQAAAEGSSSSGEEEGGGSAKALCTEIRLLRARRQLRTLGLIQVRAPG